MSFDANKMFAVSVRAEVVHKYHAIFNGKLAEFVRVYQHGLSNGGPDGMGFFWDGLDCIPDMRVGIHRLHSDWFLYEAVLAVKFKVVRVSVWITPVTAMVVLATEAGEKVVYTNGMGDYLCVADEIELAGVGKFLLGFLCPSYGYMYNKYVLGAEVGVQT